MLMKLEIFDPTKRFSERVDNYIKFRPSYSNEILFLLEKEISLLPSHTIADIGSGTGILSKMFLDNGNKVYCVEPNAEMRKAGEILLKNYENFISINGTAEETPLQDKSIDLVLAGQAFHWFNIEKSKKEFIRILKSNGWTALTWNSRKNRASKFLESYEEMLLKYSVDYRKVNHKNINEDILKSFFKNYDKQIFPNSQKFDFESLKGRLLSSSYAPTEEHTSFLPMISELKRIFEAYQENGSVEFIYDTELYLGKLS